MNFITEKYTKHLNAVVEHYWNIYHFDMTPNHTSYNNEADAFKHTYMQAELTPEDRKEIKRILEDV